jgi:soluble lytic murein transglycosylase-like protein
VVRGSKKSKHAAGSKHRSSASSADRSKDPTRHTRYNGLIDEAAHLYELPESFIRAIMHVESNFNPTVVSRAGAMGLMQLMPQTAQSMGVSDPFDVRQNILGGARYLRILANRFKGDLVLTVAAYNAGEGAVEKYDGIPPYKETQRYVRRVLKHYYTYRGDSAP